MLISTNTEAPLHEFQKLLSRTLLVLEREVQEREAYVRTLKGALFEPFVYEIMKAEAKGTCFDASIELIGGQKFPDIVARKYYGLEVKTSTQNHWKTTGNSVLESTRVDGVERIYLLFAKLQSPVAFKCRAYEDCLAEVVVTHSPRYLIDMDLPQGETIFDKMQIPYDALRKQESPIKPISDFYRSRLKEGQELWWIQQETEASAKFVIDVWNNLGMDERMQIRQEAMLFFPELFSNKSSKYTRVSIWLATRKAVVCPNIRDVFSAGGQGDCQIFGKEYKKLPRVYLHLFDSLLVIRSLLDEYSASELAVFWNCELKEEEKKEIWLAQMLEHTKLFCSQNAFDLESILAQALFQ